MDRTLTLGLLVAMAGCVCAGACTSEPLSTAAPHDDSNAGSGGGAEGSGVGGDAGGGDAGGGDAGGGDAGGGDAGGGDAGGDCSELSGSSRTGRHAASSGFNGSDDDYLGLFDVVCDDVDACAEACVKSGGTEEMCAASECLPAPGGGRACVPPPVWGNLASSLVEESSTTDMTQIVLADVTYVDHLVIDDFGIEVPSSAVVRGITVEVRRIGDSSVVDGSVQLVRSGRTVGVDRAKPEPWSAEPAWVTFGGRDDDWGEEWTAAEISAKDFGVSLSARYTDSAGNTRAYVDAVRVTVNYSTCDALR